MKARSHVPEYQLKISQGTGTTITVNRTFSIKGGKGILHQGDPIYQGDQLIISVSANTAAYNTPVLRVNNGAFTSGGVYTVSNPINNELLISSSATVKEYKLTKTQGAGTTLKITRTSSPIGKGTINTTLENNATIYYNDVLKVEVSTATGYKDAKITAGGATLTSGRTKSVTGNMTISSSASLATYTISYNLDGGAHGSSHPTTATYNTAFTVNNPTKTGYTFAGWNISGMDSTTHNYGNATTTATSLNGRKETSYKNLRASAGTVTFKATWTINTYNVAWNGNGGSVTKNGATRVQYNNNVGTLGTASRTGYTFKGWYTAASGGNKISTTTKVTGNVTYYAQWTVNNYYLDLNGLLDGNASGNTSGYGTFDVYINNNKVATGVSDYYVQHPYGAKYEIKNVKAATGHTYNGVSSGSASGTIGAGNVAVQLKFTTNSYTVSWNGNGGSVTKSGATNVKYNNSVGSLGTATRSGYTFLGWFTAASGGSQISTSTKVTGNVTYYAHWRANNYTVSWNASGGSVSPASSTLTAGSKLGTLPTPIRLGFKFTGWYTAASGGNQINENTIPTGNVTYYAHWDKYCLQDYLDSPANKRPNGNNYITGFVGDITTNGNTFQFIIGYRTPGSGWKFSSNRQYSQPYRIRWKTENYDSWFCDGCFDYKSAITRITSEVNDNNRIVIEIYDKDYVGEAEHLVDIIYITHVDFDSEYDNYNASWHCLHGQNGYSCIYDG